MRLVKPDKPVLYRGHPLARKLVSLHSFHEHGGTYVTDLMRPGVTNAFTGSPTRAIGGAGRAIAFVGASSQGIDATRDMGLCANTSYFSIAVLASWTNSTQGVLAAETWSTNRYSRCMALYVNRSTGGTIATYNGGSNALVDSNYNGGYNDGKPHLFVLTQRGTADMKVYGDGKLVLSSTTDVGVQGGALDKYTIGMNYNAEYFTGNIFMAARWSRPLNAREVATLYADPYALLRGTPFKVASYKVPSTYRRRFRQQVIG